MAAVLLCAGQAVFVGRAERRGGLFDMVEIWKIGRRGSVRRDFRWIFHGRYAWSSGIFGL